MRINYDGPYRERRGIAQELRAYIVIAKIIAITVILLIGIHTINQLDDIMTQQAIQDKTISDAMDQLMWLRMEVDEIKEADKPEIDPPEQISLGEYTITHYCACSRCCGKFDGVTASGTIATAGRTIAAPKEIPFGTELIVDGKTFVVEDRGGAIKDKRIDIFCDTHKDAINRGKIKREVFKAG